MLCGVVLDALLFWLLMVFVVCWRKVVSCEDSIFFCHCSICMGRTYIYYVDNVCEISAKEKEFSSSKDAGKFNKFLLFVAYKKTCMIVQRYFV